MATLASCIPTFGPLQSKQSARPSKPEEDPAVALATAEERGYLRGLAEAERIRTAERRDENVRFESSLAESRQHWAAEEGGRLADLIASTLEGRTNELAESIAGILTGFAGDAIRERARDELCAVVARLLDDDLARGLTVTGPADLLQQIGKGLGARAETIQFIAADTIDVRVAGGSTVIETRIGAWMRRLENPPIRG